MVGDTPERCRALVEGVDNPHLRYVWDTGNYPQAGVERSVDIGWPLLSEYTECVQVKDCRVADGTITVAGEGDGQVRELLHICANPSMWAFSRLNLTCWLLGSVAGSVVLRG